MKKAFESFPKQDVMIEKGVTKQAKHKKVRPFFDAKTVGNTP
jgi:hypothetical protein